MTLALSALVLASIADVLTTRAGIRSGLLVERNPLMRRVTNSTWMSMGVKIAGCGLALALLRANGHEGGVAVVWGAALWTGWLAWRNHRLLRAVQRDFPV